MYNNQSSSICEHTFKRITTNGRGWSPPQRRAYGSDARTSCRIISIIITWCRSTDVQRCTEVQKGSFWNKSNTETNDRNVIISLMGQNGFPHNFHVKKYARVRTNDELFRGRRTYRAQTNNSGGHIYTLHKKGVWHNYNCVKNRRTFCRTLL